MLFKPHHGLFVVHVITGWYRGIFVWEYLLLSETWNMNSLSWCMNFKVTFYRKSTIFLKWLFLFWDIVNDFSMSSYWNQNVFFPQLLSPDLNGDFNSLGSNAASDVSWENIDENESKMIRWVPDHAVTHCAECESSFGFLVRKHHCRFVSNSLKLTGGGGALL